jgi:hypothetical protein
LAFTRNTTMLPGECMFAVRLLPLAFPILLLAQPAVAAETGETLTEEGFRQCITELQADAIATGLPENLVKEEISHSLPDGNIQQ